jgi:RimJ/RimL family protein N-acetyltransferase
VEATAVAHIAWLIGIPWQGRGFAVEAARAVVGWLEQHRISAIVAHIHPGHDASVAVAARIGLRPTDEIDDDDERIWRLTLAGDGPGPDAAGR